MDQCIVTCSKVTFVCRGVFLFCFAVFFVLFCFGGIALINAVLGRTERWRDDDYNLITCQYNLVTCQYNLVTCQLNFFYLLKIFVPVQEKAKTCCEVKCRFSLSTSWTETLLSVLIKAWMVIKPRLPTAQVQCVTSVVGIRHFFHRQQNGWKTDLFWLKFYDLQRSANQHNHRLDLT